MLGNKLLMALVVAAIFILGLVIDGTLDLVSPKKVNTTWNTNTASNTNIT